MGQKLINNIANQKHIQHQGDDLQHNNLKDKKYWH
jgi:hypothetical protein